MFPKIVIPDCIDAVDLVIFSSQFYEIIKKRIPTSKQICFATLEDFCKGRTGLSNKRSKELFNRVVTTAVPEKTGGDTFVFSLQVRSPDPIVVLAAGIDETVYRRTALDWLQECSELLAGDFLSVKKVVTDPVTGLFNSILLSDILTEKKSKDRDMHLILVDLLPPARLPKDVFIHVAKASRYLEEFNRDSFTLFHIGQSVFSILVDGRNRDFLKDYCLSLITFLKNKGFKRVHCGCSSDSIYRSFDYSGTLIDEAWIALHAACRRGPFAFCDYDILANPDNFPIKSISRSEIGKLQRRWRDTDQYSLVYFKADFKNQSVLSDVIVRYFGTNNFVVGADGIFVIKKDINALAAKEWAEEMIRRIIRENDSGLSMSAGISEFPFHDYSRAEIVRNCQKALLHGAFFGYGSCVVFDAVSLNISGDIYYGEGDLTAAVKEYRKGLELDSDNINLLNSLGVAFSLMNRNYDGQNAFQEVLERDPDNFMALYNKGIGEQIAGRYKEAETLYRRALDVFDSETEEQGQLRNDIIYQLGIVCFHIGDYRDTVALLEQWYLNQNDRKVKGKCCRYIGISYYNISDQTAAKTWLQRAVVYDEEDSEALNILAELYYESSEGDEIAIKLFDKSIESAGSNPEYILRYAKCLNKIGDYETALTMIRRCSGKRRVRHEAWYEQMIAYKGLRKYNKARYYWKKLVEGKDVPQALYSRAIIVNL